jgi:hypothetical protein
MERADVMFS